MSQHTVSELVLQLSDMKVKDMLELVRELEETWGVSASPQPGIGFAAAYGAVEPMADPDTAEVILTSYGHQKIKVIKAMRELFAFGLQECVQIVNDMPHSFGEFDVESVNEIKAKIEDSGGTVSLLW